MRIPSKTWREIFERDKGFCQYCGQDLLASRATFGSAQVDHVRGVANGGTDDHENLKLACTLCNGSLSRYNHLTTFEERKAILDEKNKTHEENFQWWIGKLREPLNLLN